MIKVVCFDINCCIAYVLLHIFGYYHIIHTAFLLLPLPLEPQYTQLQTPTHLTTNASFLDARLIIVGDLNIPVNRLIIQITHVIN